MSVSNDASITLSTYALGSCIAVVAYDPVVQAAGLLHLMLPEAKISPEKAAAQPAMFADTGLPMLFSALTGVRADRSRLRIAIAGGASVLGTTDLFKIGERNFRVTNDYLVRNGYCVRRVEVGGVINRTVHIDVATGEVLMKTPAGNLSWSLAK